MTTVAAFNAKYTTENTFFSPVMFTRDNGPSEAINDLHVVTNLFLRQCLNKSK